MRISLFNAAIVAASIVLTSEAVELDKCSCPDILEDETNLSEIS